MPLIDQNAVNHARRHPARRPTGHCDRRAALDDPAHVVEADVARPGKGDLRRAPGVRAWLQMKDRELGGRARRRRQQISVERRHRRRIGGSRRVAARVRPGVLPHHRLQIGNTARSQVARDRLQHSADQPLQTARDAFDDAAVLLDIRKKEHRPVEGRLDDIGQLQDTVTLDPAVDQTVGARRIVADDQPRAGYKLICRRAADAIRPEELLVAVAAEQKHRADAELRRGKAADRRGAVLARLRRRPVGMRRHAADRAAAPVAARDRRGRAGCPGFDHCAVRIVIDDLDVDRRWCCPGVGAIERKARRVGAGNTLRDWHMRRRIIGNTDCLSKHRTRPNHGHKYYKN